MANAKLGLPSKERIALIRNQVSHLLWYGKIETTLARAKSVRREAEKLLTLAINSYEDTVKVVKTIKDEKGVKQQREVINDGTKKLAARRKIMSLWQETDLLETPGLAPCAFLTIWNVRGKYLLSEYKVIKPQLTDEDKSNQAP